MLPTLPPFDEGALLAPMAGFSDAPFRSLCRRHGAVWSITEMVSAKGLRLDPTRGIEIGAPYRGEPNLSVQLFAADPDDARHATHLLDQRHAPAGFDLNVGCPVKKITHKGCGVHLMRAPERAAAIVRAMVDATDAPVSVKMRLGLDEIVVDEVARAVVDAGAAWITVHGRTGAQRYDGRADWSHAQRLARTLPVPVVGSGDVVDAPSYRERARRGVGVMIGRGALGRPWVFDVVRGGQEPAWPEAAATMLEHVRLHVAWYGRRSSVRSLRGHLARYVAPYPEAAVARADLVRADDENDVVRAVTSTLDRAGRDRLDAAMVATVEATHVMVPTSAPSTHLGGPRLESAVA